MYSFIDLITATVLALINLGVGLSVSLKDYQSIFKKPLELFLGLIAQMIGLPLISFLIAYFAPISDEFKVGLVILAVCPGGTTSNFVTYFLKGNTALSISMTSVNSFLNLISIPFLVNLSLNIFLKKETDLQLPFLETVIQIFLIAIIPAILGVILREVFTNFTNKIEGSVRIITLILLAVVFSIKLFAKESQGGSGITFTDIQEILPYALLMNILGFGLGYFLSFLFKQGNRNAYTIGIEVGLQNTTMAFLVAGTLLQNQMMTKPSLTYSLFSFWLTLLLAFSFKENKKQDILAIKKFFGK